MTSNPLNFDSEMTVSQAIVCMITKHEQTLGWKPSAIFLGDAERIALAEELGDLPPEIDGVRIAFINRDSGMEVK